MVDSRLKLCFFILLIASFVVIFLSGSADAASCWQYTSVANGCTAANGCIFKNDSWGSYCQDLNCWNLGNQTECTTTDVPSKNCSWQPGGTNYYCGDTTCWTYTGTNESYCESNPGKLSCNWDTSCYSIGGNGCWNLNDQSVCQNTTGCAWGQCQSKGCWEYSTASTCNAALTPWGNNYNCTWSGSSCGEDYCSSRNNKTACDATVGIDCTWNSAGWCETVNCWSLKSQTSCQNSTNSSGIDCVWDGSYCIEDGCWRYDDNQNTCTSKAGCSWSSWTTTGWCEEVNCWTWDAWRGGSQSACTQNATNYGLACVWQTNGSTGGWCYKDYSSITCSNITTERECYDTYHCWWQATDWNNVSKGGNCSDPTWGTGNYENVSSNIIVEWNPGCFIFDNNQSLCNNVIGCNYTNSQCREILAGANSNIGTNISNDGILCDYINDSTLCNDVAVLSTCCSWQNSSCSANRVTSSCWNKLDQTPNGETSCEDASSQSSCDQLTQTPWYWPCKWDNSSSIAKCTVKTSDIWGNRTQNLVTIENRQTCEAVGGRWITENYCEGNVAVPTGRCEYKFDEEKNCNKACFACEYKSDGSAWSTLADAKKACLGSSLGICEFEQNPDAFNSYGNCNAKKQFKTGVAEDCDSVCGACTFLGDPNATNGTKTPSSFCIASKANILGGGCKWQKDNTTITGGWCIKADDKTCVDSCDRCGTITDCSNIGRTALTNGTAGSCKWQGKEKEGSCVANIAGDVEVCWDGKDNDDDGLIDCADPGCYSDSFCGFVEGDCFIIQNNNTCVANNCEWVNDTWNPTGWCDFKGSQCWKFDENSTTCQGVLQVTNEIINLTTVNHARIANNNINQSVKFTLSKIKGGWVLGSINITNASGYSLAGNFTIDYTLHTISFVNNSYLVSGQGSATNITNVTYQYYLDSSRSNCEWNNGTGTGWCERDWSIAEICFSVKNTSACSALSGSGCTWKNDTWCSGGGNGTDWCSDYGGWCDHEDFTSKDCWQYSASSSCNSATGCGWKADTWSKPYCEINWSGNCWQYTDSSSCTTNKCYWDSQWNWCGNAMEECWRASSQEACVTASVACTWDSWSKSCTPSCFNSTLRDSSSLCSSVSGCVWKADPGWCEEQAMAACSNSTNYNNKVNCQATSGCNWKDPGWCSPKDGFSTGVGSGGGGGGGAFGAECYKYDGNQTLCTNKTLTNISCGWTVNTNPSCGVDWSKDCWEYYNEGDCISNACWWNPDDNWCGNLADQCWNNESLHNDATACNSNLYCNATSWGGCEPTCFFNITTADACNAAAANNTCKWQAGWCNPAGVNEVFNDAELGAFVPLGKDPTGDAVGNLNSINILEFGMKDMGNAYGFGARVASLENSSICNKEPVIDSATANSIGAGNETVGYVVYLDTDGSTTGGCNLVDNSSATGYEFRLRYNSEWSSNTSKAVETFTSDKCENGKWKASDIKVSAWKKFMCSEIGGPMVAIEKGELSKFPTLYDSTKDMRVYVATTGATTNVSNPADTAGPAWATPGSIDFEISSAFAFGADAAKFEDILKKGYLSGEDCFNSVDDDSDGNIDCNDWDCQFSPKCTSTGVNAANYTDTKTPQVTGVKVEEYHDSALVLYDTNKPANGTLKFYNNDSTCSTLNKTISDIGVTSADVRDYKLWHQAEIYSGKLGYSLTNDTKYYYRLEVCDDTSKCAVSRCSSFYTAPASNKCGFCNFVTRIKTPTNWQVSYDTDQNGVYEHIQGAVCGSNAGMKTNFTQGRAVNILLNKSDGSVYFEFINASLTKTGLNDKVRTISATGDIIASSTVVGLTSDTRDKIINNLHPHICRVKVPFSGTCDKLFHCDDNGANCVDRTSEATLLNSATCVWQIPYCEFSTYREALTTSSGGSSDSGGGGGGGGGGGAGTTTKKSNATTSEDSTDEITNDESKETEDKESDVGEKITDAFNSLKNSKQIIWIVVGVLVVVGLAGGGYYFSQHNAFRRVSKRVKIRSGKHIIVK